MHRSASSGEIIPALGEAGSFFLLPCCTPVRPSDIIMRSLGSTPPRTAGLLVDGTRMSVADMARLNVISPRSASLCMAALNSDDVGPDGARRCLEWQQMDAVCVTVCVREIVSLEQSVTLCTLPACDDDERRVTAS